jgi:hypothetical protein
MRSTQMPPRTAFMLPCGKRYPTEAEAASSPRGMREGAVVRKCRSTACGGFHVTVPPVPVRAVPAAPPRPETGFPLSVRLAARKRSGDGEVDEARCESCGVWLGRYGGEIQHRLARGSGGSRSAVVNGISNAALLCWFHHALAESRDSGMRELGFWIRSGKGPEHDPRYVPMARMLATGERETVYLTEGGTYSHEPPKAAAA